MSPEQRTQGGLSVTTLLIAGAASAVAAVVIQMLWRPGTVFAAAMTPVVVALVSEALRRPVETVSAVRVRRTARGTAIFDAPPAEPFDPLAPASEEDLSALPRASGSRRAVHRRRRLTARQWRLGLLTGLAAFAAAAGVVTASELLAGDAISSGGGRTTYFGGTAKQSKRADKPTDRKSRQADKPTPTPSASATASQTATVTPSATASATPAPTVTPEPTTEPGAAPPAESTPAP